MIQPLTDPAHHRHHPTGLILALVFGLTFLIGINVVLSAQLTSVGIALASNQHQAAQLEAATKILSQELVLSTSLADLSSQAVALGYTSDISYQTLSIVHPVALGPIAR